MMPKLPHWIPLSPEEQRLLLEVPPNSSKTVKAVTLENNLILAGNT